MITALTYGALAFGCTVAFFAGYYLTRQEQGRRSEALRVGTLASVVVLGCYLGVVWLLS